MNPFTCTKEELLDAIEKMLINKELHTKMEMIAEKCLCQSKSNKTILNEIKLILKLIEQIMLKIK